MQQVNNVGEEARQPVNQSHHTTKESRDVYTTCESSVTQIPTCRVNGTLQRTAECEAGSTNSAFTCVWVSKLLLCGKRNKRG
jgi:hypothetical protein